MLTESLIQKSLTINIRAHRYSFTGLTRVSIRGFLADGHYSVLIAASLYATRACTWGAMMRPGKITTFLYRENIVISAGVPPSPLVADWCAEGAVPTPRRRGQVRAVRPARPRRRGRVPRPPPAWCWSAGGWSPWRRWWGHFAAAAPSPSVCNAGDVVSLRGQDHKIFFVIKIFLRAFS